MILFAIFCLLQFIVRYFLNDSQSNFDGALAILCTFQIINMYSRDP